MASRLSKPVSREITLEDKYGHSGDVIVSMQPQGIKLRKKGTSRNLFVPWTDLGKIINLPGTAPAKYAGNPLGWLVE